jgi:hypothetical protein
MQEIAYLDLAYADVETSCQWRKNDPCIYCGRPSDSWDHMDAKGVHGTAAGGAPNRARACQRCNHDKGIAPLLMYLVFRRQGQPTEATKLLQSGMTADERRARNRIQRRQKKIKKVTRLYMKAYPSEIAYVVEGTDRTVR